MTFFCKECGMKIPFDPVSEDPTSSSGACKVCGSHKWVIYD